MAKIRVSKIEAARRQLDTAIRLLFDDEDPVSIHTLASAGGRILRDLCEQKKTPTYTMMTDIIIPGKEAAFWSAMSRAANFFKHADKDPDGILENVDEEVNDLTLFQASLLYADLEQTMTLEMRFLVAFVGVMHPDFLKPEATAFQKLAAKAEWLKQSPRSEQLKAMKQVLLLAHRAGIH